MFSSPKRPESAEVAFSSNQSRGGGSTIIAHGVRVEGNFSSQGDVVIEGEVNGQVTTTSVLSVGTDAKLKAEVTAEEAVIAGLVDGTVTVKKRLELKSTAKILGDISCETIMVEAGATLHGKVSVGAQKSEKSPPAKTTASV